MNVSSAKRNIPKDMKSLKSNLFFISITSILCKMEVNHPVSRLPVANCYWHYYIIEYNRTQVRKGAMSNYWILFFEAFYIIFSTLYLFAISDNLPLLKGGIHMEVQKEPRFYNVEQLSNILGISRSKTYELVSSQDCPFAALKISK